MVFLFLLCLFQEGELIVDDIRIDYVETVTMVNLPLEVVHRGRPYKRLDLEDVTLVENGIRVEPAELRRVRTPLMMHFLFDLSTSNERHLMFAKRAVRDLTNKLETGDLAKLSFFSAHYQPVTDYTADIETLHQKLDLFAGVGSTALYDAIAAALEDMTTVTGSRALVVFSDGIDLISRTEQAELHTLVRNYQIPIVFVCFSKKKKKKAPLLAEQLEFMDALVAASGGTVVDGTRSHGRDLMSAIRELRFRYLLRFAPPGPENRDLWRSLDIRVSGCTDCELSYKRAYQLARINEAHR